MNIIYSTATGLSTNTFFRLPIAVQVATIKQVFKVYGLTNLSEYSEGFNAIGIFLGKIEKSVSSQDFHKFNKYLPS